MATQIADKVQIDHTFSRKSNENLLSITLPISFQRLLDYYKTLFVLAPILFFFSKQLTTIIVNLPFSGMNVPIVAINNFLNILPKNKQS